VGSRVDFRGEAQGGRGRRAVAGGGTGRTRTLICRAVAGGPRAVRRDDSDRGGGAGPGAVTWGRPPQEDKFHLWEKGLPSAEELVPLNQSPHQPRARAGIQHQGLCAQ